MQRNRLGGLLLLKGRDNQSSGAEAFAEKLKTYNVIGTYFARTLLEDMYHKKVDFLEFIKISKLNFRPMNSFAKDEIEERHILLYELVKMIYEV